MKYFHSVTLDRDECRGCTNCIKHCPTEAIRVRGGKAKIIKERCIDCGECIRVCPYHAKLAVTDSLEMLHAFRYNVAMPAPSLYGQFKRNTDVNRILTAIKQLGFDDVYEVARGAELVTAATRKLIAENADLPKPLISSACPAVVRLIKVRYPNLIGNIVNLLAPMEVAAYEARRIAREKTGLSDDQIGVFFITPCPAKMTSIKASLSLEQSQVSGAIAVKDIYGNLVRIMKTIDEPEPLATASTVGVLWGKNGGESDAIERPDCIAVDGINNVINILNEIEDEKLSEIEFAELCACPGGCVGGALNVTNSFVCGSRIDNLPTTATTITAPSDEVFSAMQWQKEIEYEPIMKLADDLAEAMRKMEQIDRIYADMPKLDCGSCGAPSCRALAEDVVLGFGKENDCIFKMREQIQQIATKLMDLDR